MEKVVAVIGGGPAGSAAAYWARKRGVRVIQFERSGPNRDKACGDALVKEAVPELRSMGILKASELGGDVIAQSSLEAADGTLWRKTHPDDCWLVPRKLMDQKLRDLAESAGVDLHYRAAVQRVQPAAGGGFLLECREQNRELTVHADAVVLAHGVNCRLSKDLGIDGSPVRVPAVSRYQEGMPPEGLHFRFDPGKYGPGYAWEFPVGPNSLNVGLFSLERTGLSSAMNRYAEVHDLDATKWRGGYEPLWTGAGRQWTAGEGGVISCGDAAGVVDPLTGEGIGPALATGRMAGCAAAEFALGNPEQARSYSDWLYDWVERKYALAHGRRRIREQLNRTGVAALAV